MFGNSREGEGGKSSRGRSRVTQKKRKKSGWSLRRDWGKKKVFKKWRVNQ